MTKETLCHTCIGYPCGFSDGGGVYTCGNYKPITPEKDRRERGKILRDALNIINGERQDAYGNPEDSFKLIAEYWTSFLKANDLIPNGHAAEDLKLSAREVAEMMMLLKIARMSGQQPKIDNYADCAGYAGIAADMVEG